MKILCVIDSLGSGGAQRQLVNLAIGFRDRGHDISFLVYHRNDFYKKYLEDCNIPIHYIIEPNYIVRLLKMRKYIRNGRYDSVLSFLESANFITTVSGFPCRRWNLIVGERSANPNVFKSFKLRFYRWFHLFTDYVVANSQSNMKIIKKINPVLPNKKCKIIYNMVTLPNPENLFFTDLKNNEKTVMIVAASQRKLKNLMSLVKAVSLLSIEEKERLKIDWYGEQHLDESEKEAIEMIKKLKLELIFTFYDPIKDIDIKMREADVVGLFSYYEGFPNTICEAMILGKPIISTRVSDIPYILKEEENGFFCEADDYISITKALNKYLKADKAQLAGISRSNKKIAEALFDKEYIINAYLELLNKVKK